MIDRDALLRRVMNANPRPTDQALPPDLADSRPPLTVLIQGAAARNATHRIAHLAMDRDELLIDERSQSMDTLERTEVEEVRRPPRWRAAAIAFAAVILIVGVGLGIGVVVQGDDEVTPAVSTVPTLTFDGETASYEGPATFDEVPVTFTLDNPTSEMVSFGWSLINDESITLEDETEWQETQSALNPEIPPWVEDYGLILEVSFMADVREASVELPDGKIMLHVWHPGDDILYPAAHITVETN